MRKTKILSFLMSMAMLVSSLSFTGHAFGHNNDAGLFGELYAEQDQAKSLRTVYLHAQGNNPTVTPTVSTVYMGDTAEVYFAIDNPNKGDINPDIGYDDTNYPNRYLEPQYDLNGYTVKIYYNPEFFALEDTSGIDYTVPTDKILNSGSGDVNVGTGDEEEKVENLPQEVGYFPYKHGTYTGEKINGKTYNSAYATIFFSGFWLPDETEATDSENNIIPAWYNLCKLPLIPLKTGNTEVFIDVDGADEYTLELFAKNTTDEFAQTFLFDTINGGYHQIIIKDKLKPAPPTATPVAGKYTETQYITLESEEGCEIYYMIEGQTTGKPVKYNPGDKIEIASTSSIVTYAKRISDGRDSNTVTYTYQIVPKAPVLYNNEDTTIFIPNIYSENSEFQVLVSEKTPFGQIADHNEIIYTFCDPSLKVDENLDAVNISNDADPSKEWAKVLKSTQAITITKSETVRLYTRNSLTGEISDVSVYYLSVKPDIVTADPDSGEYTEKKEVTLSTTTKGAEIYYTTDRTNPITNGLLYDGTPIPLYKDTTLRAVAKYDGIYSDIASYYYVFNMRDDNGVDAFYPSGVYEGSVNVTLAPYDPAKKVEYSTDGGNKWVDYTGLLVIDTDTTILARTVDSNGKKGEIYTFTYKIKPLPPVFAPESTQFTNSDSVAIFTPESFNDVFADVVTTQRYDLYYTTDGTDPITSATRIHADQDSDSATILIKDYTVISAVVVKDGTSYSNVVTHSYDIVEKKPIKPITTLTPGSYIHEIGGNSYSTMFLPIPEGTKIYYTVDYEGKFTKDPVPGEVGTTLYDGKAIEIKGHTIIKAVAINVFGVRSDIGIFEYIITPEAPIVAPGGTFNSDRHPVIMVQTVVGSTVHYDIDGFQNEFEATDEVFYIDIHTGNAYSDPECKNLLGDKNEGTISDTATLNIKASFNGGESEINKEIYIRTDEEGKLASPYADKKPGEHDEVKVIAGDDNTILEVKLYSLNSGDTIKYRLDTDTSGEWTTYDPSSSIKLTEDAFLLLRSEKTINNKTYYSEISHYHYYFYPIPPIVTLDSGTYSSASTPSTKIDLDKDRVPNKNYAIYYRMNGDDEDRLYYDDGSYYVNSLSIGKTMHFKAYVLNKDTKRTSKNTLRSYIIENQSAATGEVFIANPYDVKRISSHLLSTGSYADGIKLMTTNNDARIRYKYTYKIVDSNGQPHSTDYSNYDTPIFVNSTMDYITIEAKLIDSKNNDAEIENSYKKFHIDFVHIKVPQTTLSAAAPDNLKIEYDRNTKYGIIDEYKNVPNMLLYYTLDGSDPTDDSNPERKIYDYKSDELPFKLTGETTVKMAYFIACDDTMSKCSACQTKNPEDYPVDCENGIYGEVATYTYNVPTRVGGGGSSSVSGSKKYTSDYFGYEHPTHISYINGYPDGSVQADGHITREEMAAILYRVKNKQYERPFKTTGDVFPDVSKDRWSVTEIEYMTAHGVIKGYPEGDFKPSGYLTRAEFAALIRRFTNLPESDDDNVFSDLSEDHWAYDDIMALYSAGFINGYEDGTMRTERQITRAEVMKVMNIILGRTPIESYVRSLKVNPFNDLDEDKWYYVDVLEATITHNYIINYGGYESKWEDIR